MLKVGDVVTDGDQVTLVMPEFYAGRCRWWKAASLGIKIKLSLLRSFKYRREVK